MKLTRLRAQVFTAKSKSMDRKICQKLIRTTGPEEMRGYWGDGYVDGVFCGQMADKCRSIPSAFKLYKTLYFEYIEVGSWKIWEF